MHQSNFETSYSNSDVQMSGNGGIAFCDRQFFCMAHYLRTVFAHTTSQAVEIPDSTNRRKQKRTFRSISVSIQPLNDDFHVCGNTFWVASRNFSPEGMGLVSHEPFSHKYVRLGLMDQEVTTIAEVRHNTLIGGGKYPLYLVGVKFEGRLLDKDGNLKPQSP